MEELGIVGIIDRYSKDITIRVNPLYFGAIYATHYDSVDFAKKGLPNRPISIPVIFFTGVLTNAGRSPLLPYQFACFLTNDKGDTCLLNPYPLDEHMSDTLKKMLPDIPYAGKDLLNAQMISGPGEERGTFMFVINYMKLEEFRTKFKKFDAHFSCMDQNLKEYSCVARNYNWKLNFYLKPDSIP